MARLLRVNTIEDGSEKVALDVIKLGAVKSRYVRRSYTLVSTTKYSVTTSWSLGPTFGDVSGFKAGSLIRLFYHVPTRNDAVTANWGGMYIEPQVAYNAGTWLSLGSSGYDGGVMQLGSGDIGSYNNTILIDPAQSADFSTNFRLYFKTYIDTGTINGGHDINVVSGTATIISGDAGLQHCAHIIVEELALLRGAS